MFCLFPERVSTLAITSRVLHKTSHKLQNVLLAVNVAERVVFHRLFEVDRVQNLYPVAVSFKQLSGFTNQAALRVGANERARIFLRNTLHQIGFDEIARLS